MIKNFMLILIDSTIIVLIDNFIVWHNKPLLKKKGSLSSSNTVLIFNHAGPVDVTMQHFGEKP